MRATFAEIAALASEPDDGVVFLTDDMRALQIVENEEYEGVRLHLPALIGKIRKRGQLVAASQPDQLDMPVSGLPRLIQ